MVALAEEAAQLRYRAEKLTAADRRPGAPVADHLAKLAARIAPSKSLPPPPPKPSLALDDPTVIAAHARELQESEAAAGHRISFSAAVRWVLANHGAVEPPLDPADPASIAAHACKLQEREAAAGRRISIGQAVQRVLATQSAPAKAATAPIAAEPARRSAVLMHGDAKDTAPGSVQLGSCVPFRRSK